LYVIRVGIIIFAFLPSCLVVLSMILFCRHCTFHGSRQFFNFLYLSFVLFIYKYIVFMRESSYCFQRVLAITSPSVRPSVTQVDQSKTVQARITKSSPSAVWKTLVSGTVKLFHKFEGVTPNEGAK